MLLVIRAADQALKITIFNSFYISFPFRSKSAQKWQQFLRELAEPSDLTEIPFGVTFLTLVTGEFGSGIGATGVFIS